MMITVYPASDASLNISHPTRGKLRASGSEWPMDGFTSRMLTDKAVTLEPPKAPAPAAPAADAVAAKSKA